MLWVRVMCHHLVENKEIHVIVNKEQVKIVTTCTKCNHQEETIYRAVPK